MILGIETSLPGGFAFLGETEETRSLTACKFSPYKSERLVPAVQSMLDEVEASVGDLEGVVVTTGPGSFTGLRIGISLAKSLSFCLEIPLIGIPTLDLLAFSSVRSGNLCSLIGGYGGSLFAAFFRKTKKGVLKKRSDYLFLPLEDIVDRARNSFSGKMTFLLVPGSSPTVSESLLSRTEYDVLELDRFLHLEKAMLSRGQELLKSGKVSDPLTLAPVYVSPPRVKRKKK